ncbi:MAG: hypothetical protein HOQ22_16250 [Nocardioidaceae bacterium]|nr:hypothetical protein [Nocardioidaceae bacterium]
MSIEDSASASGHRIDPVITDAVRMISNRFGAGGLRDLIGLAQDELSRAEAALRELSDL